MKIQLIITADDVIVARAVALHLYLCVVRLIPFDFFFFKCVT